MLLPLQLLNLLEPEPTPPVPPTKRPAIKNQVLPEGGAGGGKNKQQDLRAEKVMRENEEILNIIKIFTQTQFFN